MLNKNNFEIAKLCPKMSKYSLYPFHGIRVTPTVTTVTEGHVLLQVSGIGEPESFEPFTLNAKAALKIANALPAGEEAPSLNHAAIKPAAEGKRIVIEVTNTDLDLESYSISPIEGQYPATDKVIPAMDGATMELCLDLDLLVPLLERIRRFYGNQDRSKSKLRRLATFRFYEAAEDEPVNHNAQRIDAVNDQGQTLTACIMPCRVESPPVAD